MISLLEKRPILTIITVIGVMLLPHLDMLEVTIMEARNFITAREMLTDGHWILTTMNGEARYEKPPLPTWITAISASIFGVKSVWAMRFPAVLMVMLLGSMIYALSLKFELPQRQSLLNSLISVTSLYVVLIIFEAPWDIYTHAFMLAGIYFVVKGLQNSRVTGKTYHWIGAALGIGASILSKGPVSLYVLFLPFMIAYLAVFRKDIATKNWLPYTLTLVCGLLIGFSWYLYVRYVDPETFARVATKETGNWSSYNVRPFYYYWSFFIQSGLWTIPAFISLLYPFMKTRVSNLKVYRFTLLWVLCSVVLLSIIPEKKSRYLMPVLIPLALNSGFYISYLVRQFKELKDWREIVPVYFNFGILGVALLLVGILLSVLGWSTTHFTTIYALPSFFIMVASLGVLYFLKKKDVYRSIIAVVCGLVVAVPFVLYVHKEARTVLWDLQAGKIRTVTDSSEEVVFNSFAAFTSRHPQLPIYGLNDATPEMIWIYGDKIPRLLDGDEVKMLPKESAFYLLEFYDAPSQVAATFPKARVAYQGVLDLNTASNQQRDYKSRRVAKVFLIEH